MLRDRHLRVAAEVPFIPRRSVHSNSCTRIWPTPSCTIDSPSQSKLAEATMQGLKVVAGAAACSVPALYWYALPTYDSLHGSQEHGPYTATDQAALRFVRSPDQPVPANRNPGVRVWPDLLSDAERASLVSELQPLKGRYGMSLIQNVHAQAYARQQAFMKRPPPVNMLRITGRPEHPDQVYPPWVGGRHCVRGPSYVALSQGYGDDFNESQLPPGLRALVDRVRNLPGVRVGLLRDVTINYRYGGYYRLDPHVDPAGDGETICILGLDADTGSETLARVQAERSWTSCDLDVLAVRGSLVMLCGDARWKWTHGTRLGVEKEGRDGRMYLHDWWGAPVASRLVRREDERHSVVLAFAAKAGDSQASGSEPG